MRWIASAWRRLAIINERSRSAPSASGKPISAYRADIDGLRALAVVLVIGFHAFPDWVKAGFIGVDIFFVISGYLISRIIYRAIEKNEFSYLHFYNRRIKRLIPAYVVVSLFTLVSASYLMTPNEYLYFTTSLAASWVFVSNIFFSMLSGGYFKSDYSFFPLLHTWSLSVEEQFYLLFPIALILLVKLGELRLKLALIVIYFAALALSQILLVHNEISAYYLLTTRAHELLLGGIAFFVVKDTSITNRFLLNGLAFVGLGMIVAASAMIDPSKPFPGWVSAVPTAATALMLVAGQSGTVLSSLFSNRYVVFLGLISYPLYLWHWPLFSLLAYRGIEIGFVVAMCVIAVSLVLSALTYEFVEKPIRSNPRLGFWRSFKYVYAVPAVLFLSAGALSYFTGGLPQRFSFEIQQLISSYNFERDLSRKCTMRSVDYQGISLETVVRNCRFGDKAAAAPEILLYGDSHANHLKPFVEQLANSSKRAAVYSVMGTCTPIGSLAPNKSCEARNADIAAIFHDFKYVVVAGAWRFKDEENTFLERLEALTRNIIDAGATPIIVKDVPGQQVDKSKCVLQKARGWLSPATDCHTPRQYVESMQGSMDRTIDALRARYPSAIVIDPKELLCSPSTCYTHFQNVAVYRDLDHLNSPASALLASLYLRNHPNPFSERSH